MPRSRKSDRFYVVKPHEPLRVTLEDLRSAENRGKWWLVGAAWNGDPLAENKEHPTRAVVAVDQENKLSKLARKQGMNTDIRRSIFVVLMSSEVSCRRGGGCVTPDFSYRTMWMLAKGSGS